jgi:hypothetical protein
MNTLTITSFGACNNNGLQLMLGNLYPSIKVLEGGTRFVDFSKVDSNNGVIATIRNPLSLMPASQWTVTQNANATTPGRTIDQSFDKYITFYNLIVEQQKNTFILNFESFNTHVQPNKSNPTKVPLVNQLLVDALEKRFGIISTVKEAPIGEYNSIISKSIQNFPTSEEIAPYIAQVENHPRYSEAVAAYNSAKSLASL